MLFTKTHIVPRNETTTQPTNKRTSTFTKRKRDDETPRGNVGEEMLTKRNETFRNDDDDDLIFPSRRATLRSIFRTKNKNALPYAQDPPRQKGGQIMMHHCSFVIEISRRVPPPLASTTPRSLSTVDATD